MEIQEQDAIVRIRNLGKSFVDNDILKSVNLDVCKGENVVVLGKSGSGKTTLIKCLIGLVEYDEGEIFVFGKDISKMTYKELNEVRVKMGFLFQNSALYDSMTVRENLAFPLRHHKKSYSPEKIESLIAEVLENVGLMEAVDKMPAELSGGMTKRIGLARTLILKPDIMLYDEPTAGLDTATAKEISQLMLDVQKKNKTSSIIITHDMTCAKTTADRILILKEGVIIAEGIYEELEKSEDEWVRSFFM